MLEAGEAGAAYGARVRKTGADHGDHCKALASHSEWDGKPSSDFSGGVELINCIF